MGRPDPVPGLHMTAFSCLALRTLGSRPSLVSSSPLRCPCAWFRQTANFHKGFVERLAGNAPIPVGPDLRAAAE